MKITLITNDSILAKCLEKSIVENGINLTKVIRLKHKNHSNTKKPFFKQIILLTKRILGGIRNRIFLDSKIRKSLSLESKYRDFYDKKTRSYINNKFKNLETGINVLETDNINSNEVESELRKEKSDVRK